MIAQNISSIKKKLINAIYCNSILGLKNDNGQLAQILDVNQQTIKDLGKLMEKEGLISKSYDTLSLTPKGRSKIKVVLTGGVFDIIHPGHIFVLKSAKKLGDFLIVVIATDKNTKRNKGRNPLNKENQRLELVKSLKMVDLAIIGREGKIMDIVLKIRPNIITLGYDQKHDESALLKESQLRGMSIKFVRLGTMMPNIKSSEIIKNNAHIIEEF
jgi:rfaE bifunctional protein nucleotidyltransferase chain/domain